MTGSGRGKRFFWVCVVWITLAAFLEGEIFSNKFGFSFDLPAGFTQTAAANDGALTSFVNTELPVQLVFRVYPRDVGYDSRTALKDVLVRLNARGEVSEFFWRDAQCVLSPFTMHPPGGVVVSGWALSVPLDGPEGAVLVALGYTDLRSADFGESLDQQIILSALDSLEVDEESRFEPGPVTSFAYPRNAPEKISLTIESRSVQSEIDLTDPEGAQFVIEREFSVLFQYRNSGLWQEAWQRYYRMIFRDACGRLRQPAQDITAAFSVQQDAEILGTLLGWVQKMPYERNFQTSDFTSLPAILAGQGSDCDSRAMLLAVIMHNLGYNTALFISSEYRHALLGIDINLPGAKISVDENGLITQYLLAETTAPVAPGLIAEQMAQGADWFPVTFLRFSPPQAN
jgi:hypothetical protein